MTRIVQISDTHLSATKPHFMDNWAPVREWVAGQGAALVIHTGDVTVDGAGSQDDLTHGAACIAEIGRSVLVVPGNHDVGVPRSPDQPVDADRLARWTRFFDDWWLHDIPGWRLLGLNAMLFGAGITAEAEKLTWLEDSMASAGNRRIAWFMHQPLFLEHPEEPDTGYWSIKPGPRAALLCLLSRYRVALVSSGHLHKARDMTLNGTRYIWCPATSFVVGPRMQPDMPGEKYLGAVTYDFDGNSVSTSVVPLRQLRTHRIDDVVHEVYPKPAA